MESQKIEYYDRTSPEDVFLCRTKRQELIDGGVVFGPHEVAKRFSVEDAAYDGQFGYHGKLTVQINKQLGIFR